MEQGGSVSVVIVTFRTGPTLWPCLDAAAAASGIGQILLVDNGNPQEVERRLDAYAASNPRITLFRGHGNVGFAAACNLAAARASGAHLLFLNPDLAVRPDAPLRMAAALAGAAAPALIGGDVRTAEGRRDRGARRDRVTLKNALLCFVGVEDLHHWDEPVGEAPIPVGAVSGAMMMMRRCDFEALQGFDEGYFLHVEDLDLCRRVEDAGGQVLFQPGAVGVHERSTSHASSFVVETHKARSFGRYFTKFAKSWLEWICGAMAGLVLRLVLPLRALGARA